MPLGQPLGFPDWPGFQGLKLLYGLLAVVIIGFTKSNRVTRLTCGTGPNPNEPFSLYY